MIAVHNIICSLLRLNEIAGILRIALLGLDTEIVLVGDSLSLPSKQAKAGESLHRLSKQHRRLICL